MMQTALWEDPSAMKQIITSTETYMIYVFLPGRLI
jgi:hypothetical protein